MRGAFCVLRHLEKYAGWAVKVGEEEKVKGKNEVMTNI